MKRTDLRKLNARIAYPWPIEATMPDDVTGMDIDEIIYGGGEIIGGGFILDMSVLDQKKLGDI